MEYTSRWNGFQFRSPVYLDEHLEPYRFDLVKWEQHEPYEVTEWKTGEKKLSIENCYVVGTLIWDPKEAWFDFESCGMRFLENYINGLNEWIIAFAKMKEIELKESSDD